MSEIDPRFFSARPRRALRWEEDSEGRAVLFRPKLSDGKWGRWLTRRLGIRDYRIRLDEIGTLVWKSCDGETPLRRIVAQLRQQFGPRIEPAEDRVHDFVRQLMRSRLIRF